MKELYKHIIFLVVILITCSYVLSQSQNLLFVDEFVEKNNPNAQKSEIKNIAESIKSQFRENGQTYLIDPDSHLYFRHAKELAEKGYYGRNEQRNLWDSKLWALDLKSVVVDNLRNAPSGLMPPPAILFPHYLFYFFKLSNILGNFTILKTTFYFPVFVGIISSILIYFISFLLYKNKFVSLSSSLIFVFNPLFFENNMAGYADTQVIALFYSILIMFFASLISFNLKIKNLFYDFLYASLIFLIYYFFSLTWRGASFILIILFIYLALKMGATFLHSKLSKTIKSLAILFLILLVLISVFYLKDKQPYNDVIKRTLYQEKNEISSSYFNIAELQKVNLSTLSLQYGSYIILVALLFQLIYYVTNLFKEENKNSIMLISWFLPLFIAGFLSYRFMIFAIPPASILIGGFIFNTLPKYLKIKQIKNVSIFVLILLLFSTFDDFNDLRYSVVPRMNSAIKQTSDYLKANTHENATLVTSWDEGYIWQAYAERATISDGALFITAKTRSISEALKEKDSEITRLVILFNVCSKNEWVGPSIRDFKEYNLSSSFINITDCVNKGNYVAITESWLYKTFGDKISKLFDCSVKGDLIVCPTTIYNTKTKKSATLYNSITIYNAGLKEVIKISDKEELNLVLIKDNDVIKGFLLKKEHENSMFIDLFGGKNSDLFTKLYSVNSPARIVLHKILIPTN